ncbi:hypothetical protein RUM43_012993, partial [Polyplax serrata]
SASMGQKSQDEFEHERKALEDVLKYLDRRGTKLWSFRRERSANFARTSGILNQTRCVKLNS